MSEEWRPLPGYGGRYLVSSLGRVAGLVDSQGRITSAPHVLAPQRCEDGYLHVSLRKRRGDPSRRRSVHQLVCEAFNGPRPSPRHEVAHRDGIRDRNVPVNLYWGTRKENAQDRDAHGKTVWGSRTNTSKLQPADVFALKERYARREATLAKLGEEYGVTAQAVWAIMHGKNWARLAAA